MRHACVSGDHNENWLQGYVDHNNNTHNIERALSELLMLWHKRKSRNLVSDKSHYVNINSRDIILNA